MIMSTIYESNYVKEKEEGGRGREGGREREREREKEGEKGGEREEILFAAK